jgi:ferredoxin-thioredoxin reductase catalytic subunit
MPEPATKKTIEEVHTFVAMVAQHQGWVVNPDAEFVAMIVDGLKTNYNRYGYFGCPCRDATGERDTDRDIICPCAYCRPDQEEFGHCYCGLYLTPAFAATGQTPQGIPERRPE